MLTGVKKGSQGWKILRCAVDRFIAIDGDQRAAAFAYYGFFSLFPMILLFVAVGSLFVDRDLAARTVISYVEGYVPLGIEMKRNVFDIISGVVMARGQVGVAATLVLFWSALNFFSALILAANRAWGGEIHNWWRMPLKSSLLLGVMASALLLGICLPLLTELAQDWILPNLKWTGWIYNLANFLIPLVVLFYGLSLFYKLAPRHFTRIAEVWPAALFTSVFLRILGSLFVIYMRHFARFNAVYGALGGIVALLMWIYLSGCLIVFGACLCAGRAEVTRELAATKR